MTVFRFCHFSSENATARHNKKKVKYLLFSYEHLLHQQPLFKYKRYAGEQRGRAGDLSRQECQRRDAVQWISLSDAVAFLATVTRVSFVSWA